MPTDMARRARLLAAAEDHTEYSADEKLSDGDYLLALLEALLAKGWRIYFVQQDSGTEIRAAVIHKTDDDKIYDAIEANLLTALVLAAQRALGVTNAV